MFGATAPNTDTDTDTNHHISIPNFVFFNYDAKNKYMIFKQRFTTGK
jgi:hypothetical protein